ncbi:MAG: CPBP family intramembrane metalloprotease [Anaerolineales bacterium]|nr:CPBP family intramembrane metalloprotease [Anaerolineales bacterium]
MILKNEESELRLIWRLFLLVVPFLLAAFLLRYIPVRIQTGILMEQGLSEAAALSQARYLFLEDTAGVSTLGIIQGLLWYVFVYFHLRFIEKRPCNSRSFGLVTSKKNFVLFGPGLILGLAMYFGYFVIGSILHQPSFIWSPTEPGIFPVFLVSLDMLTNGFGEETAFRAYWQRLLINRLGLWFGIIAASISFVLLHLLVARFTPTALLASFLLACLYGILYAWTGSIFLVGTLHATFNLAPRISGQWPSDTSLLYINSLALVIAVFLYLRSVRGARAKKSYNDQ